MFNFFRKRNTHKEVYVSNSIRDNWYQANSYYPLPFGLVTTVNENGVTSIGPHSFTMPYGIIDDYAILLITRYSSNTAINIQRTKKCAIHFVEFDKKMLKEVVGLGYPGQEAEEKMKYSSFTLIDSPSEGRASGDNIHPKILREGFQVYECTLDESVDYMYNKDGTSRHFILKIDNLLLKESFQKAINDGNPYMPNMPISYGFRDGNDFWFAKHGKPFKIQVPTDRGPKVKAVSYLANRMEDDISFSDEACEQLTSVPKPFLKMALKGIIKRAREEGITEVDEAFVQMINEERKKK